MTVETPDLHNFARFVPPAFARTVSGHEPEGGVEGADWLRDLPRLVAECAEHWDLRATGSVLHGVAGVVVPCSYGDEPVMLKVTWPHPEAEHEHLALRAWDGDGAVRLIAADPSRWAMLLEPLDAAHDLGGVDVDESCATIGALLRHLDRPALPQLVRLSEESVRWAEKVRSRPDALPRRIADRAASIFTELGSPVGVDDRLVHSDLHDANVLAAQRRPWLAIDPKPVAGVPEFAVAPLVWNRAKQAMDAGSSRWHLRRRVEIACEAGDLDERLALDWTFARCALNAVWAADQEDSADFVSHMVTICKAMQD
ncbi:aminoglycoside phosphotransferase family protein [Luteipulveratus sp. YIM 133132]|uniref:aminoglycoside phosphotransferase family protein n=1 Tax=Luteipulveratus flavus TaxID=3031728 RepID=UPI0023B17506|nr:aminoglycoside phosphotransferase family protein [Luteipulveratus sp. YIM 133132]MDE9367646.1 aminoglycoside phosphotransferase family protein [Luteipulveratus sp. YIM 133132]